MSTRTLVLLGSCFCLYIVHDSKDPCLLKDFLPRLPVNPNSRFTQQTATHMELSSLQHLLVQQQSRAQHGKRLHLRSPGKPSRYDQDKMPSVMRSAPRSEAEEHKGWWAPHTSLESQPSLPTTRRFEGLLQLSPAASFVSAHCFVSLRSGSGWCHLNLLLGAHQPAGPTMKPPPAPAALPTSCRGSWGSGFLHGIKQECKVNEDLIQPQVFLRVKNKRGDY